MTPSELTESTIPMTRVRPFLASLVAVAATSSLVAATPATASAPAAAAAPAVGQVTTAVLAARGLPSSHSVKVGWLERGSRVEINCKVRGTNVDGNRWWYLIADHDSTNWISARYVRNIGAAPDHCDPSDGSFAARTTARLNQREGANAKDRKLGTFAKGASFRAICYTQESREANKRWILTPRGRWVSSAYVRVSSKLRYCMN